MARERTLKVVVLGDDDHLERMCKRAGDAGDKLRDLRQPRVAAGLRAEVLVGLAEDSLGAGGSSSTR